MGLRTLDEYTEAARLHHDFKRGGGDDDDDDDGDEANKQDARKRAAPVAKKADDPEQRKRLKEERVKSRAKLSFAGGDDDDEDDDEEDNKDKDTDESAKEPVLDRRRVVKDPNAETSFLPDSERDAKMREEARRLRREWEAEQAAQREMPMTVVFSYWNGAGTRRALTCKRGTTILEFLELARLSLANEVPELRRADAQSLMFVKEDLIIPGLYTFQDLIMSKARGKSGPLFDFGVHDDVRLVSDARAEMDESHPGKVCLRSWYDRNKTNFPASRWETFDPNAEYGRYAIR